jgi:type III secretion protein Q
MPASTRAGNTLPPRRTACKPMNIAYPDFCAPALPLDEARLYNAFATHCLPHDVACGALRLSLDFTPFAPAFATRCLLGIKVGKELWRFALPTAQALHLHPDLAAWPAQAPLPPALQQAVLELVAAPLMEALGKFLGAAITVRYTALWEDDGTCLTPEDASALEALPEPVCELPLSLSLGSAEHSLTLPLRLALPSRTAANILLLAVQNLPSPSLQPNSPLYEIPLAVALEYGSLRLSYEEMHGLCIEDILLPETIADENTAWLRFYSGQLPLSMAAQGKRTAQGIVLEHFPVFFSQEERSMSQNTASPQQTTAPQAEEQHNAEKATEAADITALQVTLSFELEKRTLTLKELATLAPGYTFPLSVENTAPVTLSVNGKAVGRGRIVDINGVLGVQVTALQQ